MCGKFPCFILRICDNFNFYLRKHCRESFWWACLEFPFKPSQPLAPSSLFSTTLYAPLTHKIPQLHLWFLAVVVVSLWFACYVIATVFEGGGTPLCHSPWYECLLWLYMFSFLCHFYCIIYRVRREFSIHFNDVEVLPFSQAIKLIKYIYIFSVYLPFIINMISIQCLKKCWSLLSRILLGTEQIFYNWKKLICEQKLISICLSYLDNVNKKPLRVGNIDQRISI